MSDERDIDTQDIQLQPAAPDETPGGQNKEAQRSDDDEEFDDETDDTKDADEDVDAPSEQDETKI